MQVEGKKKHLATRRRPVRPSALSDDLARFFSFFSDFFLCVCVCVCVCFRFICGHEQLALFVDRVFCLEARAEFHAPCSYMVLKCFFFVCVWRFLCVRCVFVCVCVWWLYLVLSNSALRCGHRSSTIMPGFVEGAAAACAVVLFYRVSLSARGLDCRLPPALKAPGFVCLDSPV